MLRRLLVSFAVLCTLASGAPAYAESFHSKVEQPLKLILFAKFDTRSHLAFREHLKSFDTESVFDFDWTPTHFSDADVLVWLLSDFSDVKNAPGADVFGPVFDRVENTHNSEKFTVELESTQGRRMLLVFYNGRFLNGRTTSCFAKSVFQTVAGDERGITIAETCEGG